MRFPNVFTDNKEALLLKQRYEEVINDSLNQIDFTARKRPKRVFFDEILAIEEEVEAFRFEQESESDKKAK